MMGKPVKTKSGAMTVMAQMKEDAQKGLEGADKDSFAIPFLTVLQPMSPQIVEETVEGAKAGLLINTVTDELFSEVNVVPVAYARRYLQWAPRESGGGFKGSFQHSDIQDMISKGEVIQDGMDLIGKNGDQFKDTRQHFVLLVSPDGAYAQAIISCSSTQIKRSKRWTSMMRQWMIDDGEGGKFNPPSWARMYTISTTKETNDQGTWWSFNIKPAAMVEDPALYAAAKSFNDLIHAGAVTVDQNQGSKTESADGGGF